MLKALGIGSFICFALCLGACSLVQRSPESGYGKHSRNSAVRRTSKTNSVEHDDSQSNLSDKTRLKQLENKLTTKKEVEQYSKCLPWFKDDQERMEFLSLNDFEDRQHWLNQNNFSARSVEVSNNLQDLIEAQDISVGMPQNLVKKSWGDPDNVEVSGNPQFKNERWFYNKYVSTNDGYKKEKKIVYFEAGKVVGWEIE